MKQLPFIIIFILLIAVQGAAQNLVPNPGFEDHLNCPGAFGEIDCPLVISPFPSTVKNWLSPVPTTPDYYNACSPGTEVSVPGNFYGNNYPAHTGNAYTGIIMFAGKSLNLKNNYLEYIQVRLLSPLQAGKTYKVSCFVRPAFVRDSLAGINTIAAQYIDVAFTPTQPLQATAPLLLLGNIVKMYSYSGYLTDTTGWTEISNDFVAVGGEEWLTIGVFYNKFPSFTQLYPSVPPVPSSDLSYYLIDDVSVTAAPPCDTVYNRHDTTVCSLPSGPVSLSSVTPGAYAYRWNTGDTGPSLNITKGGTYWCLADLKGCAAVIDTFHVKFFKDTTTTLVEYVTCDTVHILSGRDNAASYLWNTGDTGKTLTVTGIGAYTVSSVAGCRLYIDNFDIGLLESFQQEGIQLGPDTSFCSGEQWTLGRQYEFAKSYLWNTGDTMCCISPTVSGTYSLSVKDKCYTYTDSIDIKISRCSDCIFVPNAFTPNKDGINDKFAVRSLCDINYFALRIYNRWGQLVFSSNDINERWNGFFKADFAASGTYFYYLEYATVQQPSKQHMKGDVLLLR